MSNVHVDNEDYTKRSDLMKMRGARRGKKFLGDENPPERVGHDRCLQKGDLSVIESHNDKTRNSYVRETYE